MPDTIERFQVLETCDLFADVPTHVQETILSSARSRRFACRQVMFVTDDPIKETFLLLEGCAKVTQSTKEGEEITLRITAPGELVGELGSTAGSKHSSTARALQDCEALVWATDTFDAALKRFPILERNLYNILQKRIGEMERRICRVSTQQASGRVASELLHLSTQIGQKVNSHVEIKIPQETLAQMTALDLWSVNRVLRGLEDQGFLKIRRMCIEVHDSPGLLGLCQPPGWVFRQASQEALVSPT